jgi:hypothetical protein
MCPCRCVSQSEDGFDLDKQSGVKQSVAFQAWGSGSDKQPTSLGLFYQDDRQKRCSLAFDGHSRFDSSGKRWNPEQ